MKALIFCWLVLLAYVSHAQVVPSAGDSSTTASLPLLQSATVSTPGVASTELYLRAKLWLLNNHSLGRYKWLGDKTAKWITLKGDYYLPTMGYAGAWFSYSLKLLLREGNYHYDVTDIAFRKKNLTSIEVIPAQQLLAAPATRKADRRYQEAAAQQVTLLLSSLRSAMEQPTNL